MNQRHVSDSRREPVNPTTFQSSEEEAAGVTSGKQVENSNFLWDTAAFITELSSTNSCTPLDSTTSNLGQIEMST